MTTQTAVKLKAWSLLLSVFLLGAMTGILFNRWNNASAKTEKPVLSLRDGETYFRRLEQELNLTPDQAIRIRSALSETGDEYKTVCAEVRPRYDALRDRARARIRMLLTTPQQERFDVIITKETCNCPADLLK